MRTENPSTSTTSAKEAPADRSPLLPHPTVHLVTNHAQGTAHIAVHPAFYELHVDEQRTLWDRAHTMAVQEGWVAPEDDDLSVVDENGIELLALTPYCRLMGLDCTNRCGR